MVLWFCGFWSISGKKRLFIIIVPQLLQRVPPLNYSAIEKKYMQHLMGTHQMDLSRMLHEHTFNEWKFAAMANTIS